MIGRFGRIGREERIAIWRLCANLLESGFEIERVFPLVREMYALQGKRSVAARIEGLEEAVKTGHLSRAVGRTASGGEALVFQAFGRTDAVVVFAAAARVAERFAVRSIDRSAFESWRREREERSLYVFDVRTPEEYEAGHLPGSRCAPGGQLVQETDDFAPVLGARVVLVDDDGVRATMTAAWLEQMGGREVAVLENALASGELEQGSEPGAVKADKPEERLLKPYERSEGVEQAMRDYLTWELGLVEQIARDGTAHWLR